MLLEMAMLTLPWVLWSRRFECGKHKAKGYEVTEPKVFREHNRIIISL